MFERQLILMTTAPASLRKLACRSCKPCANCLNPKEIWTITPSCGLLVISRYPNQTRLYDDSRFETKAVELPEDHGDEIRLWLRLLTCTTLIEGEVRSRLRERFDVTLPRFDLMAQLDKVPEGMTLSDVSKRMMVSNGNVTGLVERLVESGHLDRRTSDSDRRVQVIRLTKAGRAEFRKMAAEHELWIADIFGDLTPKDVRELMRLLAKTKGSAQKSAKARMA